MKISLLAAASVLLLSACASNPAQDPVQIKLNDIDTRLGTVERVVSNQSLVDMSRRIDALEAQLRELHGSVEVMQNGGETARKEQRDLYADLDKRIAVLEAKVHSADTAPAPTPASVPVDAGSSGAGAGAVPAVPHDALGAKEVPAAESAPSVPSEPSTTAAVPAVVAVDDQTAYNRAFDKLKSGNYGEATTAFQNFMKRYPSSSLLDNAQYWIGEAYYVTRDYDHAAKAFRAVGERWPNSRKAPDAMLKLGFTQFEQKHLAEARATLNLVIKRYPGSDAASLAQERLHKLPPEGR